MKRLIFSLALVLIATTSFAWTLSWDITPQAEGYRVSYKVLNATTGIQVDVGNATSFGLDNINLVAGTRYEMWVQAYSGTPKSYSGDSNHLRWTYPTPPLIIEYLSAPENPIINNQ